MKLQKHKSRKAKNGDDYFKWEIIIPKELVKKAGFKDGQELKGYAKKNKIELRGR